MGRDGQVLRNGAPNVSRAHVCRSHRSRSAQLGQICPGKRRLQPLLSALTPGPSQQHLQFGKLSQNSKQGGEDKQASNDSSQGLGLN